MTKTLPGDGYQIVITDAVVLSADYGQERFQYDLTSRYRPVVGGVAVDNPLNNWFSEIEDTTRGGAQPR